MPLDLARRQRTSGVHGVGTERPVVGGPAVPIGGQGQRGVGQAGEQEVADNLGDELGVVLDEFDGVSRARAQTTLGQGLLTEAVDRRDRRLVEAGQGPPDPRTAPLANPWRPGVEHDEPLVTGRQRGAFEVLSGDLQLGPDAVAKFGGCSSGVRDDEDLVDVDAFGQIVVGEVASDEPSDEGRDREGLTGARARLDERPAAGQRAGQVEGSGRHQPSTLSTDAKAWIEPQIAWASSAGDGDSAISSPTVMVPHTNELGASSRSPRR